MAVLALVAVGVLALVAAIDARHRAEQAADLAALAGASALQRGGDPCAAARRVAVRNGATLVVCRPGGATWSALARERPTGRRGGDVEVTVVRRLSPLLDRWVRSGAQARARAGPASGP